MKRSTNPRACGLSPGELASFCFRFARMQTTIPAKNAMPPQTAHLSCPIIKLPGSMRMRERNQTPPKTTSAAPTILRTVRIGPLV